MEEQEHGPPKFGIGSAICGLLSLVLFRFSEIGMLALVLSAVALVLSIVSLKTEKQERVYAWLGLLSSLGMILFFAFLFIVFYNGHC